MAPQHMHQSMLMPTNNDTNQQVRLELTVLTVSELCLTSGLLNTEQKEAVHEVVKIHTVICHILSLVRREQGKSSQS